jgi:hypothetical protein
MPLHQRSPSGHERKSSRSSSGKDGSPRSQSQHVRFSDVDSVSDAALDDKETLLDALQRANTECNKANDAKDKLQSLYEQSTSKLSEINKAKDDLKTDLQSAKDHNAQLKQELQQLKEAYSALRYENANLNQANEELKKQLLLAYTPTHQTSPPVSSAGSIPERPKPSRSSTKKDESHERTREKERSKDSKREREIEKARERESKAEKERLQQRFEGKRPPVSNRRGSFIEPWGPGGSGGRSGSVNPNSSRGFDRVATGRTQPPAVTQSHQPSYSNVPRISNPLSPGAYGNSAVVYIDAGDDDDYEDGNYHAHPIPR